MQMIKIGVLAALLAIQFGCGGGGGGDDSQTPAPTPTPAPNTVTVEVALNSAEAIGGGAPSGTGEADLTINLDDNSLSGSVELVGITADAVSLKAGFAGESGAEIIALEQAGATQWSFPTGSGLTAEQMDLFTRGGLHIEASTNNGALRGQLLPDGIQLIFTTLSGAQEVPPVNTAGSGFGALTLNTDSGVVTAHLTAFGVADPSAAHIHEALAGVNGDIVIELLQDPENTSHWSVTGETLSAAQLDALNAGRYYLNLHTNGNPGGELRGQIQPEGVDIFFTTLSGADVVPPVDTENSGTVATTLQIDARVVNMHVNLAGLDDAMAVTLNQAPAGQNGPQVFELVQDDLSASHWMLENQVLSAEQLTALNGQGIYALVTSPVNPGGELRGQLMPSDSAPAPEPEPEPVVTFASLQAEIFTPICSGCHGGASPPVGLNLSEGQAYSNLVGVASGEIPSLNRVQPGDPDNSYLVHKVEGAGSIQGQRMPLGGQLSPEQIQNIRAWIAAGAEDN